MPRYSKIYNDFNPIEDNGFFNGIEITATTNHKRAELKARFDKFCTFSWRGYDAFENFGAFIVNKNDLKFYNGPNFSNKYTNPQFESSAGQLTGVSFQVQKISFTMGVYWISEEHYRQLIYWLHPYEINTLQFDFEPDYYYQVKLASLEDSVRTVIGKEKMADGSMQDCFYTEIKLTFEVQGSSCAYLAAPYDYRFREEDIAVVDTEVKIPAYLVEGTDFKQSDLDFPITSSLDIVLQQTVQLNTINQWQCLSSFDYSQLRQDAFFCSVSISISYVMNGQEQGLVASFLKLKVDGAHALIFIAGNTLTAPMIVYRPEANPTEGYDQPGWYYVQPHIHGPDTIRLLAQPPILQWQSVSNLTPELAEECLKIMKVIATIVPTALENYSLRCGFYVDYTYDEVRYQEGRYVPTGATLKKTIPLYAVNLKYLTWTLEDENDSPYHYHINYTSEDGLVFMSAGDSEYFLLSNMTTSSQGQRLVQSLENRSFLVSGKFADPRFDLTKLEFYWKLKIYDQNGLVCGVTKLVNTSSLVVGDTDNYEGLVDVNLNNTYISARGRTNLI